MDFNGTVGEGLLIMAGSEYYDDRKCGYCGTWYGVDEHHSCQRLEEMKSIARDIQALQDKINTPIKYAKVREMYSHGIRAKHIEAVGFKINGLWVKDYG